MAKPKKPEVNYHLPEACCATCDHSGFGSYDNPTCTHLDPFESEIDFGGVCNDHIVNGIRTFNETN